MRKPTGDLRWRSSSNQASPQVGEQRIVPSKYRLSQGKLLYRAIIAIIIGGLVTLSGAISAHSLPAQANSNPPILEVTISSETMRSEEIHSLIDQAKNAWIQGDADAFAQLFIADGEFVVPGNRWVGQAAIRQTVADFAALSLQVSIEVKRILIDGEQVAVEWYWEDVDPKTGQRNRADDVIMVDFVEGKISRCREYIDSQSLAS